MMPMKNFLIYNVDSKKSYVCSNKEIQNGTLEQQLKKKKEGVKSLFQGLAKMQVWIEREFKEEKKKQLSYYNARKEEITKRLEVIEEYEQAKKIKSQAKINRLVNKKRSNIVQYIRKQGEKDQQNKFNNILQQAIVKVKPNVNWSDIADLESAKLALNEAVLFPIKFPHFFEGARKPWKGILMYGPPAPSFLQLLLISSHNKRERLNN